MGTPTSRKATCQDCHRDIHLVTAGGQQVAVDPELTAFVPSASRGGALSDAEVMTGRRVHAETCQQYREAARKERIARELRAYNRQQDAKKARGL